MQLKSTAWILAALMCGAAIAGVVGKPDRTRSSNFPKLESAVPKQFGEWSEVPDQGNQIDDPETKRLLSSIYDQLLSRTYANKNGYRIMYACANALAATCAKIASGAEKLRLMMLLPRGGSTESPRDRTPAK